MTGWADLGFDADRMNATITRRATLPVGSTVSDGMSWVLTASAKDWIKSASPLMSGND
jgi:hypothetical protein